MPLRNFRAKCALTAVFLVIPGGGLAASASDNQKPEEAALSTKDRLEIRELELRAERAFKAYTETPAYRAFQDAQAALIGKIKSITPEGFQLLEDPQTMELRFVRAGAEGSAAPRKEGK